MAIAAAVPLGASPTAAADPPAVNVATTYSSYNFAEGDYRLSTQPGKTLGPLQRDSTMSVIVDPSVTYQTYEGWGSTFEDTTIYHMMRLSPERREQLLTDLFDPRRGNNFTFMRTTIGCADFCRTAHTSGFWTYDDNDGVPDPELKNFSIQRDIDDGKIAIIKAAQKINPQLRIWASIWTPPAWMKTNARLTNGADTGNCATVPADQRSAVKPEYYPALAQYFVKYVQAYSALGIPIEGVTVQNEPDVAMTYPTTCYTAAGQAAVAQQLRNAFDRSGLQTKIWGHDANQGTAFDDADALLNSDHPAVDGLGFHNYDQLKAWTPAVIAAEHPDATVRHTEMTAGANKLIEYLRAGETSYNAWGTMAEYQSRDGQLYLPGPSWWDSRTVDTTNPDASAPYLIAPAAGDPSDFTLSNWYYTFGQFSRFIQVGAQRIDTQDRMGGVTSVAFRNPDGSVIVVASNRPDTASVYQRYDTAPATVRFVIPWGEFSDTIPGDTIATYRLSPTGGQPLTRTDWASSASAQRDGYPAEQAIDANPYTSWQSGAAQTPGQAFTIDLGISRNVDQLFLNQMEHSEDYPEAFAVSASTDGRTWTDVAQGAGTPSATTITFPRRITRYLKITLTGNAPRWWSISEVAALDSESPYRKITAERPHPISRAGWSASSAPAGTGSPAAAADGKLSTAWSSGDSPASDEFLQIDLGSTHTVRQVQILTGGPVETNGSQYAHGYALYLSNGGDWMKVAAGNGYGPVTTVRIAAQQARYVHIKNTAPAAGPWTVAEVNVSG